MSKEISSKIYEFSGFRLEEAQQRLLFNGEPVALKPKILDLLRYLIQSRGQLIAKDDLMREVWPDTIVEENNITVSMSILRKTLGEDRQKPKFIQTVPRRGYRFVAEVIELSPDPITVGDPNKITVVSETDEAPIDSLAVLPMDIGDKDPNVEYLSDGITESIIDLLSRIPNLRVLARSTVFRFKEKQIDPQEVGRLLNVRAVMMIRVMKLGGKLIIRSELVKVADGSQPSRRV
jgi:DNA-binding winged helix-turn-helix (wHTH) protein